MSKISQEIISNFLDYLKNERNYSKFTVGAYKYDLNLFEQFLEGFFKREISDFQGIDKKVIRGFLAFLFNRTYKRGTKVYNYSSKSISRTLSTVKSFFKYLMISEEIQHNPTLYVKTPKTSRTLPAYLTERSLLKLMDSAFNSNKFMKNGSEVVDHG